MKIYTTEKIDFSNLAHRFSMHRSFRKALELSASSYSHQLVRGSRLFQWDNIAPEIAKVILQDSLKQGVDIQKEVETSKGSATAQQEILSNIINILLGNKDYELFSKKLALHISKDRDINLSLQLLISNGIETIVDFQKVYVSVLLAQEKLTKNFPKFEKIAKNTEFLDLIEYLTSNPRFDKFLEDFSNRLIYNRGKKLNIKISVPTPLTKKSFHEFLLKLEINSTEILKQEGRDFIDVFNHDLFLAYLPATDLVQDEMYKYYLYEWLHLGNMTKMKDVIVKDTLDRFTTKLHISSNRFKRLAYDSDPGKYSFLNEEGENKKYNQAVENVEHIISEVFRLIAALESDKQEHDEKLETLIDELIENLKILKKFNPNSKDDFNLYINEVIFNSHNEKLIRYIPDPATGLVETDKLIRINVGKLLVRLMEGSTGFIGKFTATNQNGVVVDTDGLAVSNKILFREILKEKITEDLKTETHDYLTQRSYENDHLPLVMAPVVYRGMAISNESEATRKFVKKMCRHGDLPPDAHLLVGQENNINKHQVRSGAAATLIGATGVDGTRATSDDIRVALKFGESKDFRVLYIVRGKQAFHSQYYLEERNKNKLSEIGYTHLQPEDYVLTIIYDKNQVIVDVIVGNLGEEIQNIDEVGLQLLQSAILFYNTKRTTNKIPHVKLPEFGEDIVLPTASLRQTRPLIEIMRSHVVEHNNNNVPNPTHSVRITSHQSPEGNRLLTLMPLSEKKAVQTVMFTSQDKLNDTPWPVIDLEQEQEINQRFMKQYDSRQILTLTPLGKLSKQELDMQKRYNRILQPGFMEGSIDEQLEYAIQAGEHWLTDALCPTLDATLVINIAASLFVDYQVDSEQVNPLTDTLYTNLIKKYFNTHIMEQLIANLLDEWNNKSMAQVNGKASEMMKIRFPHLTPDSIEYDHRFKACRVIAKNQLKKEMLNLHVSQFLKDHMEELVDELHILPKPIPETNSDIVLLGSPTSGKSTIARLHFKDDRNNYVSLATDDYRGVALPGTQHFESQETDQVFVRTQDTAYLIKERIQERLLEKTKRPNVMIDGVTLENWHKQLLGNNPTTQVVVACLDDIDVAIHRAYKRATDQNASSADRGRFINTTSLIESHKRGSTALFKSIPENFQVYLYNTNSPRGRPPEILGIVDNRNGEKTFTIVDSKDSLKTLASFFSKSRANVQATKKDDLFFSKLKDIRYQVATLFEILDDGYSLMLADKENIPFVKVTKINGCFSLDVVDISGLNNKLKTCSKAEGDAIKYLVLLAHYGDLKSVNKHLFLRNDDVNSVFTNAIDDIEDKQESLKKATMSNRI